MLGDVTNIASTYPLLAALDGPAPLHDMDDAQLDALAALYSPFNG